MVASEAGGMWADRELVPARHYGAAVSELAIDYPNVWVVPVIVGSRASEGRVKHVEAGDRFHAKQCPSEERHRFGAA